MRKALVIAFLFFDILSTTGMTSQTICHVARSMRAFTFFHKMPDRGVIEQIGLRCNTGTKIMTGAARAGAGGAEYEFSVRINHRTDGDLRQCAAMLGMTIRARFALGYRLLVKLSDRRS